MDLIIDEALKKAIEAQQSGDTQEAKSLYRAILQAQPKHPEANYNFGALVVAANKGQEALVFFKTALEADPSRAQYWLSYIDALIQLDQLVDAQSVLDQATSIGAEGGAFEHLRRTLNAQIKAPLNAALDQSDKNQGRANVLDNLKPDQAMRLAKKKIKEGALEDANRIYTDILAKFPKNKKALNGIKLLSNGFISKTPKVQEPPQDQQQELINLYQQGQLQEALDSAKDLLLQYPNSLALYNIQGAAHAGLGQFDAAIDNYKQALKIKPDYADAHNNMGAALQNKNDLKAAISSFKQALKIKPDYAEAYNNMGIALKDQGDLEAALKHYNEAIKIRPGYAEAYNNMGIALQEKGGLDAAIESYKQAVKIQFNYADAHYNIGRALQEKGDLKAAIVNYKNAIEINPNYADAYNNMGNTQFANGDLEAAINSFKKALKIKPDHAQAYSNMGNVLKDQGDLDAAINSFKKALDIQPEFAEVYYNMAISLNDKGEINAAISSYKQALKINPEYAVAHFNLGNALQKQNQYSAAIESHKNALKIKPDYAEAHYNLGLLLLEAGHYEEAEGHFNFNHENSKYYLLRCLYLQGKKLLFYEQLDNSISQGDVHPMVGSLGCRAALNYMVDRPNLFCKKPLNYVVKTDLRDQCDFEKTFVKASRTILNENRILNRKQNLLTNGYQTSGNLFTLEPHLTRDIQKFIRQEVGKYKTNYKNSKEGLITHWPNEYSLYGWLVSMKSGGQLQPHMHEKGWISGSIYINVPEKTKPDSGNIVVCIEEPQLTGAYKDQEKSINVVTGSLCLFPASLLHYTIPFESKTDRIVLAFDVVPK